MAKSAKKEKKTEDFYWVQDVQGGRLFFVKNRDELNWFLSKFVAEEGDADGLYVVKNATPSRVRTEFVLEDDLDPSEFEAPKT